MTEEKKIKEKSEKTKAKPEKKSEKAIKKPRKLLTLGRKKEEKIIAAPAQKVESRKEVDPLEILKFVLMTEKSIRMIEAENKMIFIVDRKASKNDVKTAFEEAFGSQVAVIKTMNDQKGRKRAFIKLKTPGAAGEIAIRLGII